MKKDLIICLFGDSERYYIRHCKILEYKTKVLFLCLCKVVHLWYQLYHCRFSFKGMSIRYLCLQFRVSFCHKPIHDIDYMVICIILDCTLNSLYFWNDQLTCSIYFFVKRHYIFEFEFESYTIAFKILDFLL